MKWLKTNVKTEKEKRILKIITYYNFAEKFWFTPEQVDNLENDVFNWFNTIDNLIKEINTKPTS